MPAKGKKADSGTKSNEKKEDVPIDVQYIDTCEELVLLMFTGLTQLNSTLGRISDFAESKKYKGQYLPLEQWKKMPRSAGMVYEGHNFPANVLFKWLNMVPVGDFAPEERCMLDELIGRKLISCTKGKWDGKIKYLIAATHGDAETVRHELMHVLYFTDTGYVELTKKIFNEDMPENLVKFIKVYMGSKGYDEDVVEDEFQAYLCCDEEDVCGGKKGSTSKPIVLAKEKFRQYQTEQVDWNEPLRVLMVEGRWPLPSASTVEVKQNTSDQTKAKKKK